MMAFVVIVMSVTGPVLQLLDNRSGQAARAFDLQGGMGDMVVVLKELFKSADDLPLALAKVRLDVNVRRKGGDV